MAESEFLVKKQTVQVEVCEVGGRVTRGEIFLAGYSGPEARGERLSDVLGARRFVPIRGDDGLRFISNRHVVWARMELLESIDELDPETEGAEGTATANVKVELVGGQSLEGGVRYLRPAGARRLVDYLATLETFFPLRTEDWLYLVNREHVSCVVALDEAT
jgi:hypothetical protein